MAAELWPLGAAVGAICLHRFSASLQPAPELPEPPTLGRSGLVSQGLFCGVTFPCPPVFLSEAETHPLSSSHLTAGTCLAPSALTKAQEVSGPEPDSGAQRRVLVQTDGGVSSEQRRGGQTTEREL